MVPANCLFPGNKAPQPSLNGIRRYSIKMLLSCTAKRIILEMFLTHSHWEVASNYCTISYVIMPPSVELCYIISCQCLLTEGEKWLTCASHARAHTYRNHCWGEGRVEFQHRAGLHLLRPSPRGLTPTMLLTQADILGSLGYQRTGNQ